MAGVVNELGAAAVADEAPSPCLVAVRLPHGGHGWFDVMRPDRVVRVGLPAEGLEDPVATQVASRLVEDGAADAPPGWDRLGVVTGVDRWGSNALDEQLLRADLALARHEAGHRDEAAALFVRAEAALAAAATQDLAGARPGVVVELRRVLEGATHHLASAQELLAGLPEVASSAVGSDLRFAVHEVRFRGRTATARSRVDTGAGRLEEMFERTVRPPVVLVHPADVPARVLAGEPVVSPLPDGGFRIALEAFATLEPGEPATRRLAGRVQIEGPGAPAAQVVAFTLDPATRLFTAEVHVPLTDTAATLQVLDLLLAPPPRHGGESVADAALVARVQRVFSRARRTLRRGPVPPSGLGAQGITTAPEALAAAWAGDAARPLLAELLAP